MDGYYPTEGFLQRPCRPEKTAEREREDLKAGAAAEMTCLQLVCKRGKEAACVMDF